MREKSLKSKSGFTLVEALVGAAIFMILALSVYQAYTVTMNVVSLSRVKVTATALANEQFEIIRNLPYADVGIVNGLPLGKVPANQTLTRDGKVFTVKTTVRNIDDPFDGTIGGTPNDLSPADYKLAELEINCDTCRNFPPLFITTNIAPKNLESASTNGALFVKVFDALGLPVIEADIHIENNQTIPHFEINDTSNNDGLLQIVDAPPGAEAYEISVSKDGYTTDQTYTVGDPANPTPSKPHATVLLQQLTQISFNIDKISTLNIKSIGPACEAVPDIDFSLTGSKLIGTSPDIYKYSATSSTDGTGEEIITNLDWDTYNLTYTDNDYNFFGILPSPAFSLDPDDTKEVKIIVSPKIASSSLQIIVKDSASGQLLPDVVVHLTGPSYDNTLTTGTTTDCLPAGQVLFTPLTNNTYNVSLTKSGYENTTSSINVSANWKQEEILLTPEN